MGRVFQKALLQNKVDVFKFQAGDIKETAIQSLEVEFLVDTGAAMICLSTHMIETNL